MTSIRTSRIWNIAYPIVIGNVAQNLLSITDTAFIGHLNTTSLGAAALGGVFYMAIMMLGMGFSMGVQIIVARRYGEEQYGMIGQVLFHAISFMVPFAILVWGLLRWQSDGILSLLISSPAVLDAATTFIETRIWGILPGFLVFVCQSFFVGIAQTKVISYITCLMVVTNIILDWLLIFGNSSIEPMGLRGAALASVMAEIVAMTTYFVYIFRTKRFRIYGIFRRFSYSAHVMLNLIKISAPASLQNFLSVSSWFVFFIMVEKIGEQQLAISNIGRSLYTIFLLPVWGFASAVSSLVSYSIGCRKPLLIYPIIRKVIIFTSVSILVLEALTFFFAGFVTSIYTNIPELGEATLGIMPSICISALLFGAGFICFSSVSGTGNTHISLLIEIVAVIIYVAIAILSVDVWNWGIQYVWLVDGIYGIFMLTASLLYLFTGHWLKRKV